MAVGKAAIQYSREQCDARLSERMDLVAQTGTEIVELPRRRSGAAAGQVLRCL